MIPSVQASGNTDYLTDPSIVRRAMFSKWLPGVVFYVQILSTILSSSRISKRGKFDDDAWYRSSLLIRKAFESCGATLEIEGTQHLSETKGPCVIIGNHMSTAETFILSSILLPYSRFTFVVKRALIEIPVFKHIMLTREPVVVGRENPRDDLRLVMEEGCERLNRGMSVVIFPQRTRTRIFRPSEFNSIGVKLAKKAGVPVVPLALKTDAWSNGRLIKDFGPFCPERPVRFAFGAPLEIEGNGKVTNERVIDFIRAKLNDWDHPVDETSD